MENRQIIFDQFVREFSSNKHAKEYFYSRGLSNCLIDDNLIGFCPVQSRYQFSLLRGRLIVPIHDIYGNIIAMAGRQISSLKDAVVDSFWDTFSEEPSKCRDRISKWEKGKWINEPYQKTKNLFLLNKTKKYVAEKNYIILVEGYFDALSFYDNGVKNVSAICGTSISDYQISLALRYCDNICILMDSDNPGKIASSNIAQKIDNLGAKYLKIFLPLGYDPDDFSQKYDISFFDSTIENMLKNNKSELHIGT